MVWTQSSESEPVKWRKGFAGYRIIFMNELMMIIFFKLKLYETSNEKKEKI